jgi:hypothetical protein
VSRGGLERLCSSCWPGAALLRALAEAGERSRCATGSPGWLSHGERDFRPPSGHWMVPESAALHSGSPGWLSHGEERRCSHHCLQMVPESAALHSGSHGSSEPGEELGSHQIRDGPQCDAALGARPALRVPGEGTAPTLAMSPSPAPSDTIEYATPDHGEGVLIRLRRVSRH